MMTRLNTMTGRRPILSISLPEYRWDNMEDAAEKMEKAATCQILSETMSTMMNGKRG